ncbi:photosystem II protein Y [Thalassospira sp. GO-4]|jgi:F0F1-type ATP synthase membrane subunit b/b'|uniref:photosystem II protein Y n=1 Tax=Thalassospira sp. GO-4 TaxID=2946605 RepID=UPI0020259B43|nr:photosystem II protein Y [Thalassospira sp. GO-4]URK18440.1 photosystem II protein Y [Thalassospira sp. GO-4]
MGENTVPSESLISLTKLILDFAERNPELFITTLALLAVVVLAVGWMVYNLIPKAMKSMGKEVSDAIKNAIARKDDENGADRQEENND